MPPVADLRASDPASDEQRRELRQLLKTRYIDVAWRRRLYERVNAAGDLTRSIAEDGLFYARACAPKDDVPDYSIPEQVTALRDLIRTHMVPGPLAAAFRRRAESGKLTYIEADRWIREWLRLPLSKFIVASDLPRRSGWKTPDGYYGLAHVDGFPRCYRIHTLGASNRQIVEQITRADPRARRRKLIGYEATEVLRAIATDPAGAAVLFARTRKHCARCNQPIEERPGEPAWEHGYGGDCWDMIQAENESP